MGESTNLLRGVFKNGVIVPERTAEWVEGTSVEFRILPEGFTPDEQAEFDDWDKLGDEAWAMIDWGEGEIARDSG